MNGQLVGLNCLVSEVSFRGQSFDVGLFHGPDILRKAKDAGMEWKMPGKGQDSYSDSSSEGFGYDDGIEPSQF
jgi:hypothetical protein